MPVSEGTRILVVDDDPTLRESVVAYLEDSGFDTLQAGDGRQALDVFRAQRPDAMLCDLRMPGLDGMQVVGDVVRRSPETPVIVVSGAGGIGDAIAALRLGAWDYVTKPIHDMAVLEHALRNALKRARLERENRRYREHLEAVNRELKDSLYRLEKDEEAGRDVQFQLLPEPKRRFGPYEFSRVLLTSLYLSGDFLDYFVVDDDRLGFYVADVSGHGVSSAFVTVLLKSSVHQYLEEYRQDKNDDILHPARILERLNRGVTKSRVGKFLTMFYGVLDRRENRLVFANGGQYPCPILFDGHEAEYLSSKSFPVGLFEFADYQTRDLALPDTFVLAAFSDGILETLPQAGLKDKRAHLLSLIDRLELSPDALLERLGLSEHSMLPDDVTLLMLRKTA
jgi:sigma-B regulation protein RsbU (phosphoserine phosphatase)